LNDPQDAANPEDFWAEVLSGDAGRVRQALRRIPEQERAAAVEHLRRMASDPGWQLPKERQGALRS
jgi:hypothetical protein